MKVVMLCDFYGKEQTYQENYLSKYYNVLGHSCTIIASTNENVFDYVSNIHDNSLPAKQETDKYGSKIYRIPFFINIKGKITMFSNILPILEAEKPDIIYVHSIHFNLHQAVKYKKKYPNCKIIMDIHMDYTNSGKNWLSIQFLHKMIRKPYLRRYKKYISKFLPVTPGSIDFAHDIYGIAKDEMQLLPLGYDSEESQKFFLTCEKNIERTKFSISSDSFVVITGGKLSEVKKTHLAISSFIEADIENSDLIIFGTADNDDYDKLLRLIANGRKNIHFLGWIDSETSHKLMFISDLAIFPSSQSVLWQQAIGMHLPVIAGDMGNQPMDYLNQNNNLIKVEPQNLNSSFFASILKELFFNREKLLEMREGARKTAEEFLDYKAIAKNSIQ